MASPIEAKSGATTHCDNCQRPLSAVAAYTIGGSRRCARCALRYGPMLRRSAMTAAVVGTVLVAVNQGMVLVSGTLPASLLWQVPLTYAVPFCVATWGALGVSRDPG
jgi:hypothetical protein